MSEFTLNAGQKLRDLLIAVQYAAFPDDRPSPLFPFFAAIVNAIPLVWGCAMIPSAQCSSRYTGWAAVGIFNCFVNMVFAIVIVSLIRRSIKAGIRARVSTKKLFLHNIVVLFFIAYSLWEVLWTAIAVVRGSERVDDTCRRHLLAQQAFLLVYLVVGGALFAFTFVTEWGHVPRWRAYAALRYHQATRGLDADYGGDAATAAAAEMQERDDGARGDRSSRTSQRRSSSRHSHSRQRQPRPQGLRQGGGVAADDTVRVEPTAGTVVVTGSAENSDDATGRDDYSEYADDEGELRTRGSVPPAVRQVRFVVPNPSPSPVR